MYIEFYLDHKNGLLVFLLLIMWKLNEKINFKANI